MCGIFGIISRTKVGLSSDDSDVLKQMMLDTVQRGDNSSGLFMTDYQNPKQAPTGVKVLGGPHNIIYNEPLWKEVGQYLQRHAGCVIGHGRYATRGKVSAQNAHPFQYEHITLVHNGTLHGGVNYAKKGNVDIDVDSHALAVTIAEKGILEALAGAKGAYAVVVHDAKEGCLYIARNDERPLYVYSNMTRHYLMSEGPFLNTIRSRYGKTIPDQSVMYFKPETLIRIDLDDPNLYRNFGDIKALREAHEDEERKKRDKEAEENRKKFALQNPVRQNGWSGSGKPGFVPLKDKDKEKVTLARELKTTSFIVQSVQPYGTNFKYLCRNTQGLDVTFISDLNKPEYIDQIGTARIHSYAYKGGVQSMFVRHRDIAWVEFSNEPKLPIPSGEEPANAGSFLTYNRKKIPCTVWTERIKHEGCDTCATTFDFLDFKKVVLTDDDLLLCQSCAKEFSVGQEPTQKVH